jgi:DNA ligase 4
MKDLKIGLGHETLLKHYHPDALDIYNMTSDLKKVFEELSDGKARFGINKFALFYPIKPMLAS